MRNASLVFLISVALGGCGDPSNPAGDASVYDADASIVGNPDSLSAPLTCDTTGRGACNACLFTACCAQVEKCLANEACAAVLHCFDQCAGVDACQSDCIDNHPSADPLSIGGVVHCLSAPCASACGITPPTTCICANGCCPTEAPTFCFAPSTADDNCGVGSVTCAVCGDTTGCRTAADGGVGCTAVATEGQPCIANLDCKSRSCLSGKCTSATCIQGGSPCGAGHVGDCCSGYSCQSNTCCALAGATLPPGSHTQCCPGATSHTDPHTGVISCT